MTRIRSAMIPVLRGQAAAVTSVPVSRGDAGRVSTMAAKFFKGEAQPMPRRADFNDEQWTIPG